MPTSFPSARMLRGALWFSVALNGFGVILFLLPALGKLGFFTLCVIYSLAGDLPARMAWQAMPDLVLGSVFLAWARR